jgi:hypothetical protein
LSGAPRGRIGLLRRVAGAMRRRDHDVAGSEPEAPEPASPSGSAEPEAASDARSETDTAARIDAARERLRGEIPPRDADD